MLSWLWRCSLQVYFPCFVKTCLADTWHVDYVNGDEIMTIFNRDPEELSFFMVICFKEIATSAKWELLVLIKVGLMSFTEDGWLDVNAARQ